MQSTPIHTVIFDLGNVLIGWNPRLLYNKVFDDPERSDWFVNNIVTLDWNEEQDRGRPVAEATELLVRQYPEWEREIRIYYDRWTEHFSGPIPGNVELLKRLHAAGNYRLLGLTNWSAELFPWARENFDFLELFEDIMVSGEVKMKKPDPEIYEHLRLTYSLGDFSGCIFIDDSERNVLAARAAGLDAIRMKTPEQTREKLRGRGLPV
ncbi:HAD family phosphatase [Lewinella sp. W8]|uniref:HAD family hydrolase n=1 Tax=Lewinella sp. W8 TaxID=2528208 RepID=UPI001068B820|nr:HAD family phosphatase [Lewinella sp. W8]MTB52457.1 HAD-IA family hydrolase [Lewinella sp. W8]